MTDCPICENCEHGEVEIVAIGDILNVDGETRTATRSVAGECTDCGSSMDGFGRVVGPGEVDDVTWERVDCGHTPEEIEEYLARVAEREAEDREDSGGVEAWHEERRNFEETGAP